MFLLKSLYAERGHQHSSCNRPDPERPGQVVLDRAHGLRHPRWLAPLGLVAVLLSVLYARNGEEEAPEDDEAREGAAGDAET